MRRRLATLIVRRRGHATQPPHHATRRARARPTATPIAAARDPGRRRPRHPAARRPRAHPARPHRRAARPRLRPRRRGAVHRRLLPRRRLHRDRGCASCRRWTARSSSTATPRRIMRADVQLVPDPSIPTEESGTRHRTAERVAQADRLPGHLASASRCTSSRSTSPAGATSSRTPRRSCPGPTRRSPRSSATRCASTRSPAPCRRSRSRTSSPSATSCAVPSGWRWCGGSPARSRATSSSSAPTAGCSPCSSTSSSPASRPTASSSSATTLPGSVGAQAAPGRAAARRPGRARQRRAPRPRTRGQGARATAPAPSPSTPAVTPRGYRLLAKVPRLPGLVVDRLVDHFGGLQKLLAASIDDLQAVDGVGESRARTVREGLSRLAESSILERYV